MILGCKKSVDQDAGKPRASGDDPECMTMLGIMNV